MAKSEVMAETIVHIGFSARARLGILGLDVDGIMDVVRRGEVARAEFTDYDPINAGGFDAYRHRVRALRELYCPTGWRVMRDRGLELLQSPDQRTAIFTRTGNTEVGLAHHTARPQPTGSIGNSVADALGENLPLFEAKWLAPQNVARPERENWMLLVFFSQHAVRAELSLGALDEEGAVTHWFERIILPDLDPNDLTQKRYDDSEAPGDDVFDVPVVRKLSGS